MKMHKKVPVALLTLLINLISILAVSSKFFLSSLYGVFLLVLASYFHLTYFGRVKPYGINELLIWSASLPKEYKTSILSSFITIVGFFVAFHFATQNWKNELRTKLRIEAADDINKTYREAIKLISELRYFAESMINAIDIANSSANKSDILSQVIFVNSKIPAFHQDRENLSKLFIELPFLEDRYSIILSSLLGSTTMLHQANETIKRVADVMWIRTPLIDSSDSYFIEQFKKQVDIEHYKKLMQAACDDNCMFIASKAGGVRGYLLAPIVNLNLCSIIFQLKKNPIINKVIDSWIKR